jgi:hypothetical protein
MEDTVNAHPFGLVNAVDVHQNAMQQLYVDQIGHIHGLTELDSPKADRFAPVVNMVQIRLLNEDSLHSILEERPVSDSEGSTSTAASYSIVPRRFGGELFMVSHDSVTQDGEISTERGAHEGRNADRARRQTEEAAAAGGDPVNPRGNPCIVRNLDQEFYLCWRARH